MKTSIELITPDMAKMYLECNSSNRKLSDKSVYLITKAIKNGEWVLSHQGIAFNENGVLIDGQHRLSAIVQAGIPCEMMVTRGVVEEAYHVLDIGKNRSVADLYSINNKVAGMIVTLANLSGKQMHKSEYGRYIPIFNEVCGELMNHCGSMRKIVSSVGVRAIVALKAMEKPHEKDEFFEYYRNFVLLNFELLPPAIRNLYKQLTTKRHTDSEIVARTYLAFSNTNKTKVDIVDLSSTLNTIRESIARIIKNYENQFQA